MRTLTLTFHYDVGHGWLEVPVSLLQSLHCDQDISTFSYRDGKRAYLEEDCDLSTFMIAAKANDYTVRFNESESVHYSFIRDLPRYTPLEQYS